jgi:ferritin-like protein
MSKSKNTSGDVGLNRTGIATSPIDSKDIIQEAERAGFSSPGDESGILATRAVYARESGAQGLGTVPVPATLKGMAKTGMELLKGHKASVFIDKLGERLAFERTGTRLYEAALGKFEVFGSWEGGPSREQLEQVLADERAHFLLVKESMLQLGADPTAVTPSADLVSVVSMGLPKALSDPRTNLRQCLEALLVAELSDNAGWELLIELARGLGKDDLVARFQVALDAEALHLQWVTKWVAAGALGEARAPVDVDAPMP